jgi:hypothetical protein
MFKATIWQTNGKGAWFFVSIPESYSKEIRENCKSLEEGWGRLKIVAIIENFEWKTAIWFDSKRNIYLLPLKAEVRKTNNLESGQGIELTILT